MSQEFTTYRSVFDKSEYIKQGYIITYDDLDSVDDLPELSTLERQDIYHARTGDLSSDYIVPVDTDESGSFDAWRSLVDGVEISTIPDILVEDWERNDPLEDWGQNTDEWSIVDSDTAWGADADDDYFGDQTAETTSSSGGGSEISLNESQNERLPDIGEPISVILKFEVLDTQFRLGSYGQDIFGTHVFVNKTNGLIELEGDLSESESLPDFAGDTVELVWEADSDGGSATIYNFDVENLSRGSEIVSVSETNDVSGLEDAGQVTLAGGAVDEGNIRYVGPITIDPDWDE